MKNIYFTLIIAILTLVISFVSTKGTLSNLKYKRQWWKVITKRGMIVIVLTIAIIVLLFWQNYLSEKETSKNLDALKTEQDKRDSIITKGITKGVTENRKLLFNDLSEALSKQNLRLDTVSNSLHKIKDSIGKTYILDKRPILALCDNQISYEEINEKLIIPFCAFEDWIKIIDVTTYVIGIDTLNNLFLFVKMKAPAPNYELTPNVGQTLSLNLSKSLKNNIRGFYVYVKGKYTDKYLKNEYFIDNSYYYGIWTKNNSHLTGDLRKKMLEYLKSNNLL